MSGKPVLEAIFFKTPRCDEPVRDFIIAQGEKGKKTIGTEIKTVQFGWPNNFVPRKLVGNIRSVEGLSEVRSSFRSGRQQVRILFAVEGNKMVLLHGFFKQRPQITNEIRTAERRLELWRKEERIK